MITLFTTLFTGIYWLFTNTIILPSFSTFENYGVILILGISEIITEVSVITFVDDFNNYIARKKQRGKQ